MLRLISLLGLTMLGCPNDGPQEEGQCPSIVPQDPAQTCVTDPDYGGTVHHCNMCGGNSICVAGTLSGKQGAFGSVESVDGLSICTRSCATVADCAGLDYVRANSYVDGSRTKQQWSCTSLGGASYCTVAVSVSGSSANACQNCLSACRGVEGCCTGCGCICQSDCGGSC